MTDSWVSDLRRLLKDPFVLAVLAVNGAVVALYVLPLVPPEQSDYLLDYWSMVPIALLGIVAPWVWLPAMGPGRKRTFWGLWSVAFGIILIIRFVYILVPGVQSILSGALSVDLPYTLFNLTLILSVLDPGPLPPLHPAVSEADLRLRGLEGPLHLAMEDSRGFECVVTGQTVPRLTGLELGRKISEKRPGLPVRLTTGKSEALSPERLHAAGVKHVLMKPYTRRDLGWAIADLLDDGVARED